ncbi:MAG: DegT/DnrJ/EryC1/StrS family aminotransferase, partial [Deltaproteobacteria bacterium]|nr:DegT/DnrJ/EryC1/StrS family aminotransferase [Deltaproteobacteria bacterium]
LELGEPVPQPDPEAMARMERERQAREASQGKTGILRRAWGMFRSGPDVSRAAQAGKPTLSPPQEGSTSIPATPSEPKMDIQAAPGIRQMDRLESFIERRTALASLYNHAFREIDGATPLSPVPYPHVHSWHLFVIKLELERLNIDRERFLKELKARNIGAGIHFPAVHLQPYYQRRYGYKVGDFPVAEQASERILSLPLFPEMVERDVRDVVGALSEILAAHRR